MHELQGSSVQFQTMEVSNNYCGWIIENLNIVLLASYVWSRMYNIRWTSRFVVLSLHGCLENNTHTEAWIQGPGFNSQLWYHSQILWLNLWKSCFHFGVELWQIMKKQMCCSFLPSLSAKQMTGESLNDIIVLPNPTFLWIKNKI